MASLPLLLHLAGELDQLTNSDSYDCDFYPNRIYHRNPMTMAIPLSLGCIQQRIPNRRPTGTVEGVKPTVGKNGYQVSMDVQMFQPSELTVKTVDNFIVVEGKHEEREDDHGIISRQFVRKYALPKGYDPNHVVSTLSSDGVLTVNVPLPPKAGESNERIVQIQQTGPAHLTVKNNKVEEPEKQDAKKK